MDRIQNWLNSSLEADPAATARKEWFERLPTESEELSFWLSVAIKQSAKDPWWSEIDLDSATWTIPARRMKTGREHRVPLSARAVDVLADARAAGGGSGLVFPSVRGREMSDSTMSKLLRENRVGAVPHGFRSSFRVWASERTSVPEVVAELALAHVEKDKTVAAYARSDLFERRRELMNAWTDYVAGRAA